MLSFRLIVQLLLSFSFLLVLLRIDVDVADAKSAASRRQRKTRGNDRSITLYNGSKSKVAVYWIHPTTREETIMSEGVFPLTDYTLNSFVGHEFAAREVGSCKRTGGACRQQFLTVTENDDQMFRITEDFEIEYVDNKVKAQREAGDIISKCKSDAQARIDAAASDKAAAMMAMDDLVKCVEGQVSDALERVNEEIAFQADVRRDIAGSLENYTCLDDGLNSTDDIDTETWKHYDRVDGKDKFLTVHIKHERPASRIHVIENFIDDEECEAMEEAAQKKLHRATVADGKGGSRLSENRKAMQAGITVDWDKETDGDAIARLSRRVYDYVNHVLGLDIKEHGQEDLMSIQVCPPAAFMLEYSYSKNNKYGL